jgi:hypothetical protein
MDDSLDGIMNYNSGWATQPLTMCIINGGVQPKFVALVFNNVSVAWNNDVSVGLDISLRSIFMPS